ncbi:MAG: alpha/beta hydrolase [Alphaproteobacteria bacterium]
MTPPLYADADGPADGRALWLNTQDGLRLRAAVWNADAPSGTVFLLPGRSEYVEKYGRAAGALAMAGYSTLTVDWRGQGLSDRSCADPMLGHVGDFGEYQTDLDAMLACAVRENLPRPWYLLAHSMGGCIGLRALLRGLPFNAVAFSAPMWGIMMSDALRPVATLLASASRWLGLDQRYVPGTTQHSYLLTTPFTGNVLTTDPQMWEYMRQHCANHVDLRMGGPSLGWLHAALTECQTLTRLPAPVCPAICALGSLEKIVDTRPILAMMARWHGARLDLYDGAEHEVLMEKPAHRDAFVHSAVTLFAAHK